MEKEYTAIYDDRDFFNNYVELRKKANNYNDLIEQPLILSLVGDVTGKKILDIGCGYGAMACKLKEMGAKYILGIDVSEAMIKKAIDENKSDDMDYRVLNAESISDLNDKFDLIVSCLAIHYIEDLYKLFSDIYSLINPGGSFIFSMEHPMYTASKCSQTWLSNKQGINTAFVIDHYGEEGLREIEWLGKSVTKYHHKTETVINSLIGAGFTLNKVIEPSPSPEMIKAVPKTFNEIHRPAYLIVKCSKR